MVDHEAADRLTGIFRRYADQVHAYAVVRAGPQVAADVVADTFLIAWRRLDVVPQEPLPWLLGTARRVSAMHRRTRARQQSLVDKMTALAATAPGLMAERDVDNELWRALDGLRAREREAVLLTSWFDLSNAEAAAVQGCATGTFAARLHRARRHLRSVLEQRDIRADQQMPAPSQPTRMDTA